MFYWFEFGVNWFGENISKDLDNIWYIRKLYFGAKFSQSLLVWKLMLLT